MCLCHHEPYGDEDYDGDRWDLAEIAIRLSNAEMYENPVVTTVDGMLQMLECPCYAVLWR